MCWIYVAHSYKILSISSLCYFHWSQPQDKRNYCDDYLPLPIAFLKILCLSCSFLIRSSRYSLWRLATGLEAMASTSVSDMEVTTTGEKIFSSPRTICRLMTWVVMFAIKVFCWTYSVVSVRNTRVRDRDWPYKLQEDSPVPPCS